MRSSLLCALALLTGALAPLARAADETPTGTIDIALPNSGFEEAGEALNVATPNANNFTGTGALARGWSDNSGWAAVGVRYQLDASNPHGGQTSQRVEVTRVENGAAQFVAQAALKQDHIYRFSVWLRGRPGSSLTLQYQQRGTPYAIFGTSSAQLSAEWREYAVLASAPADAEVFLMLRATEPLEYWADDAKLQDLTRAVSGARPNVGNLLPGASFESGIGDGWNARVEGLPDVTWRDFGLESIADEKAPVGARVARLQIADKARGAITTPVVALRFGVPHTFSAWMRCSRPDTTVSLELDNTPLRNYPTIGPNWTRVSWTFTPTLLDYYRLRIAFYGDSLPARTLEIDGAQLEEGAAAAPAYIPATSHEMTLRAPRAGHIFFTGEAGTLAVNIAPAPPAGARIALAVSDEKGVVTDLPAQPAAAQLKLPFGNARQGIWKLRATLQSAQGEPLCAPTELVWTRLPRPAILPQGASSYFGIHIPLAPNYIGLARDTGQRWVRLHDTSTIGKWPVAEPEPGQFRFYDEPIDAARAAGLSVLGMFDGAPARASTQPITEGYWSMWNIPDKPGVLDEWKKYVGAVTTHYRGRIDNWEVWNEPWGKWWIESGNPNATPQLYAQLMKAAHDAAHGANPIANVLGVDTFSGHDEKWTRPVLAASGTESYDTFSFHDYNGSLVKNENRVAAMVQNYAAIQKEFGAPKPQWNTEGGPGEIGSFYAPQTGGLPIDAQAAYIVRYDVSSMAAGVQHFFLYAIHSGAAMGDPAYRAAEHDLAPRPILAARAVLASLVDGRTAPNVDLAAGLTTYVFAAQNGQPEIRVVWSDAAPQMLTVPARYQALDVWGNVIDKTKIEVGAEPIYLRAR